MLALEHVAHQMPRLGTRHDLEHFAVVLGGGRGAGCIGLLELVQLAQDVDGEGDGACQTFVDVTTIPLGFFPRQARSRDASRTPLPMRTS